MLKLSVKVVFVFFITFEQNTLSLNVILAWKLCFSFDTSFFLVIEHGESERDSSVARGCVVLIAFLLVIWSNKTWIKNMFVRGSCDLLDCGSSFPIHFSQWPFFPKENIPKSNFSQNNAFPKVGFPQKNEFPKGNFPKGIKRGVMVTLVVSRRRSRIWGMSHLITCVCYDQVVVPALGALSSCGVAPWASSASHFFSNDSLSGICGRTSAGTERSSVRRTWAGGASGCCMACRFNLSTIFFPFTSSLFGAWEWGDPVLWWQPPICPWIGL